MADLSAPMDRPKFRLALPCVLVTAILTTWGVLSVLPGCACSPGMPPRDEPLVPEDGEIDTTFPRDRPAEWRTEAPTEVAFLRDVAAPVVR